MIDTKQKTGWDDDRQISDAFWKFFKLFLVAWAVSSLLLPTPSHAEVRTVMVGDVMVVEHIDTHDGPAKCGEFTNYPGCYVKTAFENHIYYNSPIRNDTVIHERAHAEGMRHGEWHEVMPGSWAAAVTESGGPYRKGDTIWRNYLDESIQRGGE